MALFRRNKTDEPVVEDAVETESVVEDAADVDDAADDATDTADSGSADEATEVADADKDDADKPTTTSRIDSRSVDRTDGPFDRTEVDNLDGYIDFGAIAIAPVPDMELRLDVDEAGTEITGLTVMVGESACQMQAFAAPKSRGVWDAIRGEIHDNLLANGSSAEEHVGPLGVELHVRMAARGADGRTTYSPATFVGVDGPRWFLRAVLSGRAAAEDQARAAMLDLVRGTIVTRGSEPRAPREMLPLKVPDSVQTEAEMEPLPTADEADTDRNGVPNPFERGPEITEVR